MYTDVHEHGCSRYAGESFYKLPPGVPVVRPLMLFVVPSSRTLWGQGFGECTTCRETGDPAWTCPAVLSAYSDIGGQDADVVELEGGSGKR